MSGDSNIIDFPPHAVEPMPDADADGKELSLDELYKQIYTAGELIIIIDKMDELRVRKGLSSIKAKQAQKLKGAGFHPEDVTLEFIVHDFEDKDKCKLQIVLKQRPTVKVHKVIIPTD